jgi:hypothetical protein
VTRTKPELPAARVKDKRRLLDSEDALRSVRTQSSFIKWPTKQEIQEVSSRLAHLVQAGMRSEANGDYFKSGDLAYQIQEIIRATTDLSKKSERGRG